MKRITLIYFVGLLVFVIGNTGYSQTQKVISLAPSITKHIYLLQAQDQLVGATSYCEPAKADDKDIVANAIDVNIEKVIELQPDVVLTTKLTKQSTVNTLEKMGIQVEIYPSPLSFEELCNQFIQIGSLVGKEALAQSIVAREKATIQKLQEKVSSNPKPKIFIEVGAKPLWTAPGNTFMHDYIVYAGGQNIAKDLKNGSINREAVLIRNPDVIVIVTMGMVAQSEKANWKKYSSLSAVEKDNVFVIDADQACSPTPVSFRETVEEMISKIYR